MIGMTRNANGTKGFALQPIAVLQGFIASQFFLLLISVVLAFAVYFSPWKASPKLLHVLAHAAVFAGAVWAGLRCQMKAWLHGILVGVLAFVVFSVVGYGGVPLSTWLWWRRFLKMGFVAMLGGILGGLSRSS